MSEGETVRDPRVTCMREAVRILRDQGGAPALADLLAAAARHVSTYDCEMHCEYPDGCQTTVTAARFAESIIAEAEGGAR